MVRPGLFHRPSSRLAEAAEAQKSAAMNCELDKGRLEWTRVSADDNLKRLHRMAGIG